MDEKPKSAIPFAVNAKTGSKNLLVSDKGNLKDNDKRKFNFTHVSQTRKYRSAVIKDEDFACLEEIFNPLKSQASGKLSEDHKSEKHEPFSIKISPPIKFKMQEKPEGRCPSKSNGATNDWTPDGNKASKFEEITFWKPDCFEEPAELPDHLFYDNDFSLIDESKN